MTNGRQSSPIEQLLAKMLSYGTWISAGIIAIGLCMGARGLQVTSAGIVLLILLPTFRVILMLGAFVRRRDYKFATFAAIVLTIIVSGFVLGTR